MVNVLMRNALEYKGANGTTRYATHPLITRMQRLYHVRGRAKARNPSRMNIFPFFFPGRARQPPYASRSFLALR
jgi:hypothetical protein